MDSFFPESPLVDELITKFAEAETLLLAAEERMIETDFEDFAKRMLNVGEDLEGWSPKQNSGIDALLRWKVIVDPPGGLFGN